MKTSGHNLTHRKQANKPPSLIGDWNQRCSPGGIAPRLTRVHIARSDLLLVFAAGKLGAFEPLLHSHVTLLDPASAQFGAF